MTSPGSTAVADGVATLPVKMTVKDKFGNPPQCFDDSGTEVPIEVGFNLPVDVGVGTGGVTQTGPVTIRTNLSMGGGTDGGVATINVWSKKAGTHHVTGLVGSNPVTWGDGKNTAPNVYLVPVRFTPGVVELGNSLLTVVADPTNPIVGKVQADGADRYSLKVETRDVHGNLTPTTDPINFYITKSGTGPVGTVERIQVANPTGVAAASFATTWAGTYFVWATIGAKADSEVPGNAVPGSPAQIVFVAGPWDPSQSTITPTRKYVEANVHDPAGRGVVDTGGLVVTLKDAHGNVVTDVDPASVVVTKGAGAYAGNVTVGATQVRVGGFEAQVEASNNDVANRVNFIQVFGFMVDGRVASSTGTVTFVPTPLAPKPTYPKAQAGLVSGTAEVGMTVRVFLPGTTNVICSTVVDTQGRWTCRFNTTLADGDRVEVVATNLKHVGEAPAGSNLADYTFMSVRVVLEVRATVPGKPVVDPSNGDEITGEIEGYDKDKNGPLEVEVIDKDGNVVCVAMVNPVDGTFKCTPDSPPGDGEELRVVVTDDAGNKAEEIIVIDRVVPSGPFPDPTDGTTVSGHDSRPGNTITVTGKDGQVLCATTVKADKTWECSLSVPQKEGDMIYITEKDPAGNSKTVAWRVGLPKIVLDHPRREVAERQVATGYNFQPGERVQATLHSNPYDIGWGVADGNGTVRFDFIVPVGTTLNVHEVWLRGSLSGTVKASFEVYLHGGPTGKPLPPNKGQLPYTGSGDVVGLTGAALGVLLTGLLLLLAAKRRRREQQEAV
jgi:LPXTG-motif cell wall-anchored protein